MLRQSRFYAHVDFTLATYLRERDHVLTGAGSRTYGSGITYLRERDHVLTGAEKWLK
jgi:hypothetical protein